MPDANQTRRPLSPHLTIYRPQLTSMTSILTRITGNALLLGGLLVVAWFLAAATSAGAFEAIDGLMTSWPGDIVMTLSLWALWYHALAGVRHLIWDSGHGLDLAVAQRLGWGVIFGSVVLSAITVAII